MNFTRYLPFEDYVLTTKLTTLEVLKRIADNIEPRRGFTFASYNIKHSKLYTGEIHGLTFIIARNINYRNSFLPVITGQIETFPDQTEIRIKMRLARFVLAFILFWIGTAGMVCIGIIIAGLSHIKHVLQKGFPPVILIPFVMFIFGYLLTTIAFKFESKNSTQFLSSLLDGSRKD